MAGAAARRVDPDPTRLRDTVAVFRERPIAEVEKVPDAGRHRKQVKQKPHAPS
jgi:hypothetical protein